MNRYIIIIAISLIVSLISCEQIEQIRIKKGVSKELADYRKEVIEELNYDLFLQIPENKDESIIANIIISFNLKINKKDLQLDFKESPGNIKNLIVNDKKSTYTIVDEHIILPKKSLIEGINTIQIEFIAGDLSLNRNKEFLYTLFVPDRARTAFPCFDQPNLKGTYKLTLDIPAEWTAIANGKLKKETLQNGTKHLEFGITKPLPTYLFAFVAGKFEKITQTRDDFSISIYHRETNQKKIETNKDSIFDLVFHSLEWLEKYTKIEYPFAKYDIIAIPSFQYGGMEHTGATLYRSSRIFLDESATQDQYLRRANLIAHETAHMWFGDYVTMEWFDEVWLKEVFANFIADKIVKPGYPNINFDLMFLMNHFPASYGIDRTKGANPINQKLDNLKDAGTVYGAIIYHKAPIVMQMLENKLTSELLQQGLQEYLSNHSYGNANWNTLINILDAKNDIDLRKWSNTWVFEEGMPKIYPEITSTNNIIDTYKIKQSDLSEKNRTWEQNLMISLFYENQVDTISKNLMKDELIIEEFNNANAPYFSLLNSSGLEYGYFELDQASHDYLLQNIADIEHDLIRGICWLNLYENFLNQNVNKELYIKTLLSGIAKEDNDLIAQQILKQTKTVFWKFLNNQERIKYHIDFENTLWNKFETGNKMLKKAYFNAYKSICISENGVSNLQEVFYDELKIKDFSLSENESINLALELAIKDSINAENYLNNQLAKIENPDNKEKLNFIAPSVSADKNIRDEFFESLKLESNRSHEPWVETAVSFLHHPLRNDESIHYILPSLELLREIQETGDIFFPLGFIYSTLSGHNSKDAYEIVTQFLNDNPDYPEKLKLKILQANDLLERSVSMNINL